MIAAGYKSFNAAVIGAGGFGRHYARILAQLNHRSLAGVPRIDRLIVTRTRLPQAIDSAAALWENHHPAVDDIIPAEVHNAAQLDALLQTHRPGFIAIVARDPEKGDAIHADYAKQALRYGQVMCEKPFCPATGGSLSLGRLTPLIRPDTQNHFGLDLPMAAVLQNLLNCDETAAAFRQARSMSFFWRAPVKQNTDLINDLALHPWSLIPEFDQYRINRTDINANGAEIDLTIRRSYGTVSCRIVLQVGPAFRGMQLDQRTWVFFNRRFNVQIVAVDCPLTTAVRVERPEALGEPVMEIDNPLEQHLLALLRGRPVVNLSRTLQSQLFLEKLFDFAPAHSRFT